MALLLAVALMAVAPTAGADEDARAAARRYFDAGKQAYEAGQYLAAATALEEAYSLLPSPAIAFSLAQAHRRQYFIERDPAKVRRAAALYKTYVVEVQQGGRRDDAVQYIAELEPILMRLDDAARLAPGEPAAAVAPPPARPATQIMVSSRTPGARAAIDDDRPAEVPVVRDVAPGRHRIRVEADGYFADEVESVAVAERLVVAEVTLRERPARLAISAPGGAEVTIDGRAVAVAPRGQPIEVPAGRHLVAVTRRGYYPHVRELTLERGQELVVAAGLERTTQRKVALWTLGGAGLVALGGGATTILALAAQANAQEILDRQRAGNIDELERQRYERLRERRDDLVAASGMLYGGAVAVGLLGALIYFIDSPRVEATRTTMIPVVSQSGAGAAVVGRF